MAWTKKARQASTNLYQHIDKGHWPGDSRAGNLHDEGEVYLEVHHCPLSLILADNAVRLKTRQDIAVLTVTCEVSTPRQVSRR